MLLQSTVTIMAEVLPDHEDALRQLLESAGQDPAHNSLVPFASFPNVHFARFFIWPAATHPLLGKQYSARLLFLVDVDGLGDQFLDDVAKRAADGLHAIFSHCRAYPGRSGLRYFLEQHAVPYAAKYVNTIGRTVEQIRQEASLREAIQGFLDRSPEQWRCADPRRVRGTIQQFVEREPSLAWARRTPSPPPPAYVLGESLHAALVGIAGIVLFPVILLGAPIWLYFLRRHELANKPRDVAPTDAWIEALAAQQDNGIQNPFSSAGFVKPGPFYRFTGAVIMWGTNFLTRHVFNHANLIGVKTIHTARWVFIDRKERLFFCSNYDGSLENYMNDFIDKIAWALNTSFSGGVDYPRTNWLVLDGAHNEQAFKRFNLTHQLLTPFWYAAYQGLTALSIDNNAEIRRGLYGPMDEVAARVWLKRL